MSGSENCCCQQDPCEQGTLGACCLPNGTCQVLSDCDCRLRSGQWQGAQTTCPTDCQRCYCCSKYDTTGAFLRVGYTQTAMMFSQPTCQAGYQGAWIRNSKACTSSQCNTACSQDLGACCYDCGCTQTTACQCAALRVSTGRNPNFGFREDETCTDYCEVCLCINGMAQTSYVDCANTLSNQYTTYFGPCTEALQDPAFVNACSGGGGGGGGYGPPVYPPVGPRPPSVPPTPPRPCTRPADYNIFCTYKVWFVVQRDKLTYQNGGCGDSTETITFPFGISLNTDVCDKLGLGNSSQTCNDVEKIPNILSVKKKVTNCSGGDTETIETREDLTCGRTVILDRYEYPCEPCPDLREKTWEMECVTNQKLRECCDTKLNNLTVRIPDSGFKRNGNWVVYNPGYTVVIDLTQSPCVGYDRNHSSCQP